MIAYSEYPKQFQINSSQGKRVLDIDIYNRKQDGKDQTIH